ncbi:helix-turn-helix domain-containing protein [Ornithinibacillus californiensis]|uniref:helix-turn-helix domain-containing protein n=1 Tax=Ornithinibacillus californiensis TaxID=161536 RepID=UPI00064D817D|nr:helix-turn-helix domain-containing protein [Ornithinibacillus californiensis]
MVQEVSYHINLQEIKLLNSRLNEGIQVIMVISGELVVETDSRFYMLEERDLLVLNQNQLYQINSRHNNRVLVLKISNKFMELFYPAYRYYRFECYSKEIDMGRVHLLKTIQKLLVEMLISYYRKDESHKIEMQSYCSRILLTLIRGFKQKAIQTESHISDNPRINKIINYIEESYKYPITLEETAKKFYISAGYLSRYFKQKMDIGFNRYLMKIRLNHAVKDLLYTSHSIGQIALDNGFPNAKSFTTLFKETYKDTPKAYREKNQKNMVDEVKIHQSEDTLETKQSRDILNGLQFILEEDITDSYKSAEWRTEELTIDISLGSNQNEKIVTPKYNLSIGELKELLREDVRSQILMTKKNLGLDYVGVSRLITGSTIIPAVETDEIVATTSPYYNADFAITFLKQHSVSLFIKVDYQEITENEQYYFTELENFLKHCLTVFGRSFIKTWKFMFYEPSSTIVNANEMKRVYLKFNKKIKYLIPELDIGVFFPFFYREERTSKKHEWMMEKDIPIDFYGYDANQNEIIDFENLDDERFTLTENFITDKTGKLKEYFRKNHKEKPLHLVSWNTLTGNTRYTNGTFFRGALVFKSAFEIAKEVDSIGFWINTELHENRVKNRGIRLEGMELFHYFSGKRPAFFSMEFLQRLNGSIIAQDNEYIMTENERGYQLVLMNYNTVNPYYSTEETLLRKLNKDIHVTIKNLEPGEYQIRKRIFDKDHGALYNQWWKLNSKFGIDEEVIQYIINSSQPSLELFDKSFKEEWSFYSYLTFNAIHFFEIRKIKN